MLPHKALELRQSVATEVAAEVQARDPEKLLPARDFSCIVGCVADRVCARILHVQHASLDEEDRAFIRLTSARLVRRKLHPGADRRFGKHERVVCHLARGRVWAPGIVTELDRVDPEDPLGEIQQIPYLVQLDPPNDRVVCVPRDEPGVVRAEVCFGQRADTIPFALFCKPQKQNKARRFGVGDRVACAVEDASNDDIAWAAGTVTEVNFDVGPEAKLLSASWDWPRSPRWNGGSQYAAYQPPMIGNSQVRACDQLEAHEHLERQREA